MGVDKELAPAAEPAEKENIRAVREARQAAQEEDGTVKHEIPWGTKSSSNSTNKSHSRWERSMGTHTILSNLP